jgi:hypothetical protein
MCVPFRADRMVAGYLPLYREAIKSNAEGTPGHTVATHTRREQDLMSVGLRGAANANGETGE